MSNIFVVSVAKNALHYSSQHLINYSHNLNSIFNQTDFNYHIEFCPNSKHHASVWATSPNLFLGNRIEPITQILVPYLIPQYTDDTLIDVSSHLAALIKYHDMFNLLTDWEISHIRNGILEIIQNYRDFQRPII